MHPDHVTTCMYLERVGFKGYSRRQGFGGGGVVSTYERAI